MLIKRGQFKKEYNVYQTLFPHVKNDVGEFFLYFSFIRIYLIIKII